MPGREFDTPRSLDRTSLTSLLGKWRSFIWLKCKAGLMGVGMVYNFPMAGTAPNGCLLLCLICCGGLAQGPPAEPIVSIIPRSRPEPAAPGAPEVHLRV